MKKRHSLSIGANLDDLLEKSEKVAFIFNQLSHAVRLQIMCCLSEGEKSVGELAAYCKLSQPNTSQFLARMKKGGLVSSQRNGQTVYYRIHDPRVLDLLVSVKTLFC